MIYYHIQISTQKNPQATTKSLSLNGTNLTPVTTLTQSSRALLYVDDKSQVLFHVNKKF